MSIIIVTNSLISVYYDIRVSSVSKISILNILTIFKLMTINIQTQMPLDYVATVAPWIVKLAKGHS